MKAIFKNNKIDAESAILIVDRVGVFGEKLSEELSKDYLIILVSNRQFKNKNHNIIQLRFSKRVPKIPKNNYLKIYLIDDGREVTREVFKSISKETLEFKSELFVLSSLRNSNTIKYDQLIKNHKNSKLLIFGDVFDNGYYFENNSSITRFLKGVRSKKKIVVENDGLGETYPITLKDTLKLIVKASFIKVPQKIILLFSKAPITDMTLAHMFQKIDPEIDVDFKDTVSENNTYLPKNSTNAIKNYNLFKELRLLNFDKEVVEDYSNSPIKNSGFGYAKYLFFFVLLMVFVFLLPFLSTNTYSSLGYYQMEKSHEKAQEGDFEGAVKKIESSIEMFNFALRSNEILEKQLTLINIDNLNNNLEKNITEGILISNALGSFYEGLYVFTDLDSSEDTETLNSFKSGINSLKSSYSYFQKINLDSLNNNNNINEEIISSYPFIEKIIDVSEVLPVIFGEENELKYLLLFQDSTDLRPSGGVVRVVAVLSYENMKLNDLFIKSIDEIDLNEKDSGSASYISKRYLKESVPTIENSGINLDGVNNAVNASTVYGLAENVEVDGVIQINSNFIKKLLKQTGPIVIEGVGDVTEDNFYEILISSDDKNKFYKELVEKIYKKSIEDDQNTFYLFFQMLGDSIVNKDVVFAFRDPEIQNIFSSNNLSGSLTQGEIEQDELGDIFGLFETSIESESRSQFISRSVTKINKVSADESINSELSISFKNNTPDSLIGSSNYKAYVQLLLPLGSIIDQISVGGQKKNIIPAVIETDVYEEGGFNSEDNIEIRQSVESGHGVYGFYIEVPKGSTKIIKLNYNLPFELSTSQTPANYNLKTFKQPGVEPYPFNLIFISNSFQFLPKSTYSGIIDKDFDINFLISEK